MEDEWGRLLRFGAANGHVDLVLLALEHIEDIDADLGGAETALFLAAQAGQTDTARLLLTYGARAQAMQAFVIASADGHTEVVRLLNRYACAGLEEFQTKERWPSSDVKDQVHLP